MDSDIEHKEDGNQAIDLEDNEFRTEEAVNPEIHKVERKWSRKRQDKLLGECEKESKRLN